MRSRICVAHVEAAGPDLAGHVVVTDDDAHALDTLVGVEEQVDVVIGQEVGADGRDDLRDGVAVARGQPALLVHPEIGVREGLREARLEAAHAVLRPLLGGAARAHADAADGQALGLDQLRGDPPVHAPTRPAR